MIEMIRVMHMRIFSMTGGNSYPEVGKLVLVNRERQVMERDSASARRERAGMVDLASVFSSRVENYVRYRPGYPWALIELLRTESLLSESAVVADVGSGTGLLSRLFLRNGNVVFGVEPNPEMRAAAEALLSGDPRFLSVDGRAEATTLGDRSVDFVTAGQAFHWFEPAPTKAEFTRILKPGGWVVLVWNVARTVGTPFGAAYGRFWETYLRGASSGQEPPDLFAPFFGPGRFIARTLDNGENSQLLDLEALKGRVLSSAAAPQVGQPRHEEMLAELKSLFAEHQQGGIVTIEYDTQVVYGRLWPA